MQTETDLTNLVKKFKKILPTIDSGDGFYYVDPDDCDLEKFFSDLIISKHQLWLSQLRKEIEGVTSKPESWDCKCGLTHYMDKNYDYNLAIKDVLNLLQETK